ncbi:MAG TPA: PAS domain-containing sensor histidine kinase [Gaiellaceae bacterium]
MKGEVLAVGEADALGEDGARLAAIVEHMPAALIIVDLEGNVQLANQQARGVLGAEREIPSSDAHEWDVRTLEGSPYAREQLPVERSLRTGEVVRKEQLTVVALDGSTVFVEASSAPVLDSAGQTIGAVCIFQDVTEQERLERAGREFVTNAAHELQSPLAAIVSAIDVLQAGAKDSADRDVFLDHIERESARLARLARALMILARAQIGIEAARDEIVSVQPILEAAASRLRVAPGVEVAVECGPELAVVTNTQLLEQAVGNLAENAAKHTSEGRIVLAASQREGGVEITVTDTGSGIAAAELSRVFDRFYRGSVGKDGGFGLGLAIVRAATDALGGEVELDSADGEGTVVRLRLPNAASLVGR